MNNRRACRCSRRSPARPEHERRADSTAIVARRKVLPAACWVFLALALQCGAGAADIDDKSRGNPETAVLTNIQRVVALGSNVASGSYTARLRGVIIYVSPPTRRLYVQEGKQGLQVNLAGSVNGFHAGQEVQVEGEVVDGLPFPRIMNATARILGEGRLPDPKPTTADRLAAGKDAFRFVSLRGVVRDMTSSRNALTLLLSEMGRPFEVTVPASVPSLPREWMDAEVELRGIAYPFYNSRTLPTDFRFHAPSLKFIRVTCPGAGTLFDRPAMTIAEASRQPWDWQRRLKIVGSVTAHQPVNTLFLDDGTGPMQVNLISLLPRPDGVQSLEHDTQVWLEPGDRIEVIGVRRNWFSLTPTLIHAEFRRVGKAPPVRAQPVSIADLRAGRFSGRVVSVQGRLLDQRLWNTGNLQHQILVLQAGDQIFQAAWESEMPANWDLQPGSYVRVSGVNDAMQGRFNRACVFQILLRSPGDVVVVPPPPFWTKKEFHRLAMAGGGVALLAGAWILLQRAQMRRLERRVADRTAELSGANLQLREEVAARERAENEIQRALAQEKQLSELKSRFVSMVSHEFRTPLGIITSSAEILDAYLDRLPAEERKSNLRDITDATRDMSRMMEEVLLLGRVEAGKMTCRPTALDLVVFCQRLVDEVRSATANRCPIELTCPGEMNEALADESLLRHIFTNLINNAVKYSPAGSRVEFRLEAQGNMAVFTVSDRGIGIPKADVPLLFQAFHRGRNVGGTQGTGLGMTIVKRCVDLHGGRIACESQEGNGATFIVVLPLFAGRSAEGEGTTTFIRAAGRGPEVTFVP